VARIAKLSEDLRREALCRACVLRVKKLANHFAVYRLESLQMRFRGSGVAVPRRLNGPEDEVRYPRHGGNYHYNAVLLHRAAYDPRTLAYALRIAHGGAAKLHHD
jgi:hypothetical protein